jgi:hypothetical protein
MLPSQKSEGTRDEANNDGADGTYSNSIRVHSNCHADELCGVPRYVAQRQINAIPQREQRAVRHILVRLQGAQESHDVR